MEPINEPPPGYRPSGFEDRLRAGCGLIGGGLASMGVAFLMWQYVPLSVPLPPGIPLPAGFAPMASPIACMIPMIAVLAAGLVLLGVWKLIGPE